MPKLEYDRLAHPYAFKRRGPGEAMALELLGRKVQMGNIFLEDGLRVSVTFLELVPLTVTQVKHADKKDGYSAVQVGYDPVPGHRLTRAEAGHQKLIKDKVFRRLTEIRVDNPSDFTVNQTLGFDIVNPGDKVDVRGTSKGRGFTGAMKRHNFHGQSGSHGTSKVHRKPMSAGATDAARVFKGTRKPGRMGAETCTVKNLEVALIDTEKGVIALKGSVPGPNGVLVRIIPLAKSGD
ncbi:MAG TPA: 50S ribosomal protein L3 [Firmicutes bacterium]|nr:50S ribosomal protein L3 [Bacillota bacterium]